MTKQGSDDTKSRMEKTLARQKKKKYILRLFITGTTPASTAAILNLRKICDEYIEGRYELDVIDIYQHPAAARDEQIIAAPTLIKKLPLPIRKFIGDMADKERILAGLNLDPKDAAKPSRAAVRKERPKPLSTSGTVKEVKK